MNIGRKNIRIQITTQSVSFNNNIFFSNYHIKFLKLFILKNQDFVEKAKQSNNLMNFLDESSYYDELAPYFVKDALNKDSFVIPPPNLTSQTSTNINNPTATTIVDSNNSNQAQNITESVSLKISKLNLFDNYVELLTEILLRIPYQMKKLCTNNNIASNNLQSASQLQQAENSGLSQYQLVLNQISNVLFDFSNWIFYLCEYYQFPQCYYLKRLIKKMLQIICNSRDKYRLFKDQHILTTSVLKVVELCPLNSAPSPFSLLEMGHNLSDAYESITVLSNFISNTSLTINTNINNSKTKKQYNNNLVALSKLNYSSLVKLVDSLKQIAEIAVARSANWQRFCIHNSTILLYLIELAMLFGVDSNGSGTDSSNLNGNSSISTACTSTTILPIIIQLLTLTLNSSSLKTSTNNVNNPSHSNQSSRLSSITSLTNRALSYGK